MEQNGGFLQLNSQDQVQGHQKVVGAISRAFGSSLNNKQLYTAADVLEIMAQTKGLTGEQYLAKYARRSSTPPSTATSPRSFTRRSTCSRG